MLDEQFEKSSFKFFAAKTSCFMLDRGLIRVCFTFCKRLRRRQKVSLPRSLMSSHFQLLSELGSARGFKRAESKKRHSCVQRNCANQTVYTAVIFGTFNKC